MVLVLAPVFVVLPATALELREKSSREELWSWPGSGSNGRKHQLREEANEACVSRGGVGVGVPRPRAAISVRSELSVKNGSVMKKGASSPLWRVCTVRLDRFKLDTRW